MNIKKKKVFNQQHSQTDGWAVCSKQPPGQAPVILGAVRQPWPWPWPVQGWRWLSQPRTRCSRDTGWTFPRPAGGDQHSATATPVLQRLSEVTHKSQATSSCTLPINEGHLSYFKSSQNCYCWPSLQHLLLIWIEFTPAVNQPSKTDSCSYKQWDEVHTSCKANQLTWHYQLEGGTCWTRMSKCSWLSPETSFPKSVLTTKNRSA